MKYRSRGIGTTGILLLLVLVAALGVFFVQIFTLGQEDAALDAMSAKAFQAAKAGIEWGKFKSMRQNSCGAFTLSGLTGLEEMRVDITCQRIVTDEGGQSVTVDEWIATACNTSSGCGSAGFPGPGYVERQLRAVVAH